MTILTTYCLVGINCYGLKNAVVFNFCKLFLNCFSPPLVHRYFGTKDKEKTHVSHWWDNLLKGQVRSDIWRMSHDCNCLWGTVHDILVVAQIHICLQHHYVSCNKWNQTGIKKSYFQNEGKKSSGLESSFLKICRDNIHFQFSLTFQEKWFCLLKCKQSPNQLKLVPEHTLMNMKSIDMNW